VSNTTSKTIEIIVSPTGHTTVQTKGFTGPSCRDATKVLERALGIVESDTSTAEMYQTQTASARSEVRQ
jgi:hypothetical protein